MKSLSGPPRGRALTFALGSGITAAAIDVLSGLLSGGFGSTFAMAASAAVVLGVFVALNLAAGSLLSYWQHRRGAGTSGSSHATAAVILTTGFAALATLKYSSSQIGTTRSALEALACALPALGWAASGAYRRRPKPWLRSFALAIPFWLAAAAVFEWLRRYPEASARVPAFLLLGGFFVAVLLAGLLTFTSKTGGLVRRCLLALALVIAMSPFAALLLRGMGKPAAASTEAGPRQVKRVILITVDTLRADAISSDATPRIHELSRDSLSFADAISPAPWTVPAVSSLMTGVSPAVHGGTHSRSRMSSRFETLAERLRDAGYVTAAVGKNPFLLPERNLDQGFMEYRFYPRSTRLKSLGATLLERAWPEEFRNNVSDGDITDYALDWVAEHQASDFFLWVHYFDPHHPYLPPPRFRPGSAPPPEMGPRFDEFRAVRQGLFVPSADQRAWIQELYQGEVGSTDRHLGRFLDGLRDLGLYDDSLIVFTSDHGEEFWEHDGLEHGHSLYRELLAVPLMVKVPGAAEKGEVQGAVSTERVMATVLEACGIRYAPQHLAPPLPLRGGAPELGDEPVVSSAPLYYEDRIAIRFGRYWYIHSLQTDREELYDLEKDAGQRVSIAEAAPEELHQARNLLAEWRGRMSELRKSYGTDVTEEILLSPTTEEHLRSLGYVQ